MIKAPTTRRTRWVAAAGILGAAAAFAAIAGAGPAPALLQLASGGSDVSGNCDEAEHANDLACGGNDSGGSTTTTVDASTSTTTTVDASTSTTVDNGTGGTLGGPGNTTPADEIRTIDANGAGIVVVAIESGSLRLVAATPSSGWQLEIEQSAGREIEVDFRYGSQRVQVNVELEDGQVRVRVRPHDDANDSDDDSDDDSDSDDDDSDDDSDNDDNDDDDDDSDDDDSDDDDSDDDDDDDDSDDD